MQRSSPFTIIGARAAQTAALTTCLTLAVACGDDALPVGPTPATPAFAKGGAASATSGRIFFGGVTGASQAADVFVMHADGSGVTALTTEPGPDGMPSARLDGRSVVFVSRRSGQFEIYSMKSDGTGVVPLTTSERGDRYPAISPDGRRIAFTRVDPATFQIDLFVMRANGTNIVQVTNDASEERWLTFSPDGQQIAFERWGENGDREIYRVNVDGTGLVNLTNNPTSDDVHPAWAPDGSVIAFGSERNGQATDEPDIYTMNTDGSNVVRRTTFGAGGAQFPAWSPDSKKLVFFRAGQAPAVYTMNVDGTSLTQISQVRATSFSWAK